MKHYLSIVFQILQVFDENKNGITGVWGGLGERFETVYVVVFQVKLDFHRKNWCQSAQVKKTLNTSL